MKKNFVIVLFTLVSACHPRTSYDFVIRDVSLFDGEKDRGIVNIAINGDTIAAISKDPLDGDSILEGRGKYLIPGLVNSHVHIWELEQLKEGYDAGVLAHMGMHSGNPVRDSTLKAASADAGYPFYYSSGVAATVPGGHPTEITPNIETINDSISVRQFVDHRVSLGADYIKITKESTAWYAQPEGPPSLPYDSIKKLIEYAHAQNKKTVVHIGSLIEMTTIAHFKPDGFVHMWYSANDADLTEEKLKVIKESGAFIVPTARVNERALALVENEGPRYAAWARENFLPMDGLKEAIGKVHRAGITILAGTDNGNFDLNWGDDLINELILYQQSGMSNIEALKTATGNPAKVWNIPVGFLNVGSRANMLLIDGNPLEDLNRLKQIEVIWKNGRSELKD